MQIFTQKIASIVLILCAGILLTAVRMYSAGGLFALDAATLDAAKKRYGTEAHARLQAWEKLIQEGRHLKPLEKLVKVNTYFNRIYFVSDINHWQKKDYWASPVEFIASNGGDCEDFSLAKYFTLRAMDVPESQLLLTYVKSLELDQAHMVLTYYPAPDATPLVLDNLINAIKPASQRKDLFPIYSFNGSGLWLSKQRGQGKFVGTSDRLRRWRELLQRLPENLH